MKRSDSHYSDEQLLLELDGELSATVAKQLRAHLDSCWKCRVRRQELEQAIAGFVDLHNQELDSHLPSAAGPAALLKARIDRIATPIAEPSLGPVLAVCACLLLALGLFLVHAQFYWRMHSRSRHVVLSIPVSSLTPGATLLLERGVVCAQDSPNNRTVPVALRRKVFEEYGIPDLDPRAYEIDYLVTPALGGAEDIHNLWPHSTGATAWNSKVKDALEDRLRQMVCAGNLELATAQQEIAGNWIAAYKKYFKTDEPLPEHSK